MIELCVPTVPIWDGRDARDAKYKARSQKMSSKRVTWEILQHTVLDSDKRYLEYLNHLFEEGWEPFGVEPHPHGRVIWLKRRVPDEIPTFGKHYLSHIDEEH